MNQKVSHYRWKGVSKCFILKKRNLYGNSFFQSTQHIFCHESFRIRTIILYTLYYFHYEQHFDYFRFLYDYLWVMCLYVNRFSWYFNQFYWYINIEYKFCRFVESYRNHIRILSTEDRWNKFPLEPGFPASVFISTTVGRGIYMRQGQIFL